MLVPIFGENGAIIVQYAVTLAVVVALIVLVVWGVRRYGNNAIRPATRSRLPRLAIVDTLPVDNKRKLVLLRRDNVEHLILVGGPSDVVVEPSIVRQRVAQRSGQGTGRAAAGVAPAPAEPTPVEVPAVEPLSPPAASAVAREPASAEPPLHFPARRATVQPAERTAYRREPVRGAATAATVSPVADPVRSYRSRPVPATEAETSVRREPVVRLDPVADQHDARAESRTEPPASRFAPLALAPVADEPPDGPVPGYDADAGDSDAGAFAPPTAHAEPDATPDLAEPSSLAATGEPPAEAVEGEGMSDLEQEMARLLGEISTTRRE